MADIPATESVKTLVRGLEKRKACDLCHIKKIKCDAKKPTCTHCSVYGAQCAYTPHIKKRRKEVKIQPSAVPIQTATQVPVSVPVPEVSPSSSLQVPPLDVLLPRLEDYFLNLNCTIPLFDKGPFMRMLNNFFANCSSSSSPTNGNKTPRPESDPLFAAAIHLILALTYQHQANHLPAPYPKFSPHECIAAVESLTSNLETCSDAHSQFPNTTTTSCGGGGGGGASPNHQNEEDSQRSLLGIQVLLGYTLYRLSTPRSGAVSHLGALVGRIIKLVHRMELNRCSDDSIHINSSPFFNNNNSEAESERPLAVQRARVFWIAYILDRHISMNSHDPPLQQDDDLDVPIPISTPGYGIVTFSLTNPNPNPNTPGSQLGEIPPRQVSLDIFTARIHLSRIQGIIYNLIYSVRATSSCRSQQGPEMLAQNIELIRNMLDQWLTSMIPPELYPENLGKDRDRGGIEVGPPSAVRELVALYFNYLFCFMHTYKVGHHHAEWIRRLVGYSQEVVASTSSTMTMGPLGIGMGIVMGMDGPDMGMGMGMGMGQSPMSMSGNTPSSAGGSDELSTTDSGIGMEIGSNSGGGGMAWVSSPGWDELVKTARECARLFRLVKRDDGALLWMTSCAYISSALVLVANRLTAVPEHHSNNFQDLITGGSSNQGDEEDILIAQAIQYLHQGMAEMPQSGMNQLERMAAALEELSCRARLARAKFGLFMGGGGGNQNNMATANSSAIAWLENEARKSAGFSAIDLVSAFTGAEQKTVATRAAYRGRGVGVSS